MEDENKVALTAFLVGRHVYLRPPDIEKDVLRGTWFSWFNNKQTTKYLGQGIFPNTIEKQKEFVESLRSNNSKVVLCIIDKSNNQHIGVISLSEIDLFNRKANISIVIGEKDYPPEAPLESMALMTEYGFDRLNLNKIDSGQCIDLWVWINTIALIGYQIEGYIESIMIRDGKIYNGVHTGITASSFYKLKKNRNGKIGTNDIQNLLRKRSKINSVLEVEKFFLNLYSGEDN